MVKIIPSINVQTFEEVQDRIAKIEPYVEWAHLDVTDGIFSKHLTWHNPSDLTLLDTKLKLEVHLMVEEPERVIEHWLISPIKRIIVHLEASKDIGFIIDKCRKTGIEVGLATNPETFWGEYKPWFNKADVFFILGVEPGPPGQSMKEGIVDKIKHLRDSCPSCIIEIDGNINLETIGKVYEAGANLFVSGLVFKSPDIKNSLDELSSKILINSTPSS